MPGLGVYPTGCFRGLFLPGLEGLFGVEDRWTAVSGASPLFAKPEMGSVRFRVHKIRRRPWPSAACVRPASVPARTPCCGTRTPAMTGRRVAWPSLSSPPALTRRTPTKRTTLRLRGGASLSARRLRSLAFLCSSAVLNDLTLDHHLDHLASLCEPRSGDPGAAAPARTGPRQRDDHALICVIPSTPILSKRTYTRL